MNELRILFARSGDALTYRLATSWGGDAGEPQPFVPFLGEKDYEDLRWYLEEYMDLPMGGALVRASRVEQFIGEWGKELRDAIFSPGHPRAVLDDLLRRDGARGLTVASSDLDVLRQPWEILADGAEPLFQRGVTIRRQLELAGDAGTYDIGTLPLRILLVVSRPDDLGFIDPRHTTRAMLDALAPLGDGVVVDFCRPATLKRMREMLHDAAREGRGYHIVHFDGHGDMGVLCFEGGGFRGGRTWSDAVPADELGGLLAAHRVPLAILEACRSGKVGRGGVAPRLIEAGVGSVLAMSHAVHVEATRVLLRSFYESLVAGASIGQAVEKGRAALVAEPNRWMRRGLDARAVALQDWFLPTLYQRGADVVLVPEKAPRSGTTVEARRAPATGDEPGAFPRAPMYGFFGRAPELQRLERRFLGHRAVVLHAMGGMGKTSLAREAALWLTQATGMFPDGACFVSFEQAGGAHRAVQVLGAYFEGVDFERRPAEEQERRARELFQTKRVLVVWDNFESVLPAFQAGEAVPPYPEEERTEVYKLFCSWVAEETGLGRLLVTCRPEETNLGVCKVELGGLAQADALAMLHQVMQKAEVQKTYKPEELVDLLKALDYHPLSIELVGPHLKNMGPEEIGRNLRRLLDEFTGEAEVERNRSLRASIEFSLKRLSEEAREAVWWLRLFHSGVFEDNLLNISQMDPAIWDETRRELEATALVKVDAGVRLAGKPYLRFHPTLTVVARHGVNKEGGAAIQICRSLPHGYDED